MFNRKSANKNVANHQKIMLDNEASRLKLAIDDLKMELNLASRGGKTEYLYSTENNLAGMVLYIHIREWAIKNGFFVDTQPKDSPDGKVSMLITW